MRFHLGLPRKIKKGHNTGLFIGSRKHVKGISVTWKKSKRR